MTTMVGTQDDFVDALRALCELDFDAILAYEAAIERLDNPEFKIKLREFCEDHRRHTREINELLTKHAHEAVEGADSTKSLLAKGKVVLADMVGDNAILKAMKTNEDDTNTAYERLVNHANKWLDAELILNNGLADERRHREWIERNIT